VSVTADTFDGVRYGLTIGRGGGENLPVQLTAEALPDTAAKFKDRVVFLPRNFVAPFLQEREELLSGVKGDKKSHRRSQTATTKLPGAVAEANTPPGTGPRRRGVSGPGFYSASFFGAAFLAAGFLAGLAFVSAAGSAASTGAVSTHSRTAMGALSLLRGPSLTIRV